MAPSTRPWALDPQRLFTKRAEAKLTQAELAEMAGIHPVTLSRIEGNKVAASAETLHKLAKALKCTVAELMPVERAEVP